MATTEKMIKCSDSLKRILEMCADYRSHKQRMQLQADNGITEVGDNACDKTSKQKSTSWTVAPTQQPDTED